MLKQGLYEQVVNNSGYFQYWSAQYQSQEDLEQQSM